MALSSVKISSQEMKNADDGKCPGLMQKHNKVAQIRLSISEKSVGSRSLFLILMGKRIVFSLKTI